MKNFILLIIVVMSLSACDNRDNLPRAQYDLGDKVTSDPFVGIGASLRIDFFEQSLEWPVFEYFKPDSVNKKAYLFDAYFDEESVRQKANVDFCIVNDENIPYEGLTLYCGDVKTADCHFTLNAANGSHQQIKLRVDIPYEWGDTTLNGQIMVCDDSEIDGVNDLDINGSKPIGSFCASQKISLACLFWLLWAVILGFLLYYLLKAVIAIITSATAAVATIKLPSIKWGSSKHPTNKNKAIDKATDDEKEKDKDEKEKDKYPFFMKPYIGEKYEEGISGSKVLVITASQYCSKIVCPHYHECTKDCGKYNYNCWDPNYNRPLDEYTIDEWEEGCSTYRRFLKCIDSKRVDEMYHHVAAYLFYQQILPIQGGFAKTPQYSSEKDVFDEYYQTFESWLATYHSKPDVIVVWGIPVKDAFMNKTKGLKLLNDGTGRNYSGYIAGREYTICFIDHPSYPFFDSEKYGAIFYKALANTRK